ncbi:hypothetical protein B0T16DRAFT_397433 [Cercophora newfieldiana]|uniref:Uncharacterized protein n=1 Tax=Cercophora newfieldiana TaxID=92897 RepID=A0AA39YN86_9PEZI|nr:hypothetical protein B0T16DRAFT_397433 [Cercophora newfieldiana]
MRSPVSNAVMHCSAPLMFGETLLTNRLLHLICRCPPELQMGRAVGPDVPTFQDNTLFSESLGSARKATSASVSSGEWKAWIKTEDSLRIELRVPLQRSDTQGSTV